MPVVTVNEESVAPKIEKDNTTEKRDNAKAPKFGFGGLLSSYGSNLVLDADADEYLSKLRKIIEDPAYKIKIKAKKLSNPAGAVAFLSGSAGVVLLFQSAIEQTVSDINNRTKILETAAGFKENFGNITLLNIILVTTSDYGRYTQMANHLTNVLQAANDPNLLDLSIANLNKHQLIIDTEINTLNSFYNKYSPHGVLPRCDFGFVLSAGTEKAQMNNQYNQNMMVDNSTNLFGVSGYVEFIEENVMPGTPLKFTPIVHISDITSVIPSAKILSLAISISAEVFIRNMLWKQQYLIIKKGKPSIGNLINDNKTNKPWNAKQDSEIIGFFNQYITPPLLVIDVLEGKARNPGIEKFIIPSEHSSLISEFESFLNVPGIIGTNSTLGTVFFDEVIGETAVDKTVSPNGIIDSRKFDYLFVIDKIGYNRKFENFKFRYADPMYRVRQIEEIAEFNKTNLNRSFLLNSDIIKIISNELGSKLTFFNPTQSMMPTINANMNMQSFDFGTSMFGIGGQSSAPVIMNQNIYQ